MKAIVLGATSGMGRAIAQKLAARGDSVYILGIGEEELTKSAADLTARNPRGEKAEWGLLDLEKPETFLAAIEKADAALGGYDTVIVTAGLFATGDKLEEDTELARRVITVNYANTVIFCEYARKRLLERGGGTLVVFSSVAGDRGRKPQILYGSAKAGLSVYCEALDHKYHAQGLHVLCVKPGFVHTGMTAGLKAPPFAGEPDQVAGDVLKAIDAKKPVLYTPSMWALVMLVIRWLPRFVMRKINF